MKSLIILLFLINCIALSLNCNICECKPQKDIQTCVCRPNSETDKSTDCARESHKLQISTQEMLIPKKYNLKIIQSIIVEHIALNKLRVSFTNELLPELYHLAFHNCSLTVIEKDAFFNVQNTTHLILKHNSELHLRPDSFDYLRNLTYLNLENNRLHDFPDNIFQVLVKLRELNLDANQLQNITKHALRPLINLEKIHFRKNEIQNVRNDLFESNINLEIINFNGNEIEFLDRRFVEKLHKLRYLYLDNNPLNCNCSLRDFYDEYKMRNFNVIGQCVNYNFMFTKLERQHFNCPEKLITTTKTQNDNHFYLNCTIESDYRHSPNATWIYENNTFAGVVHNESYFVPTSNFYYLILKINVDPQEYYENNLICSLLNETLQLPVIYSPIKLTEVPDVQVRVRVNNYEDFDIKNISDKLTISYNFTIKNDFNITWIIQTLQPDINLIFNYTEYSVNIIFDTFPGKCILRIHNESSVINISKTFTYNDNTDMTELFFFTFQYKDKHFYSVNNNSFCFVNNTHFNNSELGHKTFQYKCNNDLPAPGAPEVACYNSTILIIMGCIIASLMFVVIFLYCYQMRKKRVTNRLARNQNLGTSNRQQVLQENESSPLIHEIEQNRKRVVTLLEFEDINIPTDEQQVFPKPRAIFPENTNIPTDKTEVLSELSENNNIPTDKPKVLSELHENNYIPTDKPEVLPELPENNNIPTVKPKVLSELHENNNIPTDKPEVLSKLPEDNNIPTDKPEVLPELPENNNIPTVKPKVLSELHENNNIPTDKPEVLSELPENNNIPTDKPEVLPELPENNNIPTSFMENKSEENSDLDSKSNHQQNQTKYLSQTSVKEIDKPSINHSSVHLNLVSISSNVKENNSKSVSNLFDHQPQALQKKTSSNYNMETVRRASHSHVRNSSYSRTYQETHGSASIVYQGEVRRASAFSRTSYSSSRRGKSSASESSDH